MKMRVSKHQGVSPRTRKPVKGTLPTLIKDHIPGLGKFEKTWE